MASTQSIGGSQLLPLKPLAHTQLYAAVKSVHVPPFWHGAELHSSMSVSHMPPEKPAAHAQLYASAEGVHPPSFWHGPLLHAVTAMVSAIEAPDVKVWQ